MANRTLHLKSYLKSEELLTACFYKQDSEYSNTGFLCTGGQEILAILGCGTNTPGLVSGVDDSVM